MRDSIPASSRLVLDFAPVSHWAESLPEGCTYWNVQSFFPQLPKGEPSLVAEAVRRLVDLAQLQPSIYLRVDVISLAELAN